MTGNNEQHHRQNVLHPISGYLEDHQYILERILVSELSIVVHTHPFQSEV